MKDSLSVKIVSAEDDGDGQIHSRLHLWVHIVDSRRYMAALLGFFFFFARVTWFDSHGYAVCGCDRWWQIDIREDNSLVTDCALAANKAMTSCSMTHLNFLSRSRVGQDSDDENNTYKWHPEPYMSELACNSEKLTVKNIIIPSTTRRPGPATMTGRRHPANDYWLEEISRLRDTTLIIPDLELISVISILWYLRHMTNK